MPKVSSKSTKPDATPVATPGAVLDAVHTRIKTLRKRAGLSAAELDRLTGLCAGTTGRLERGDQKVYASHLYRIAQATGVDIGWFYREDGAPPAANNAPGPDAPGLSAQDLEKQRLLDAYMRINDPGLKRDVFELVETLAKTTGKTTGKAGGS